MNLLHLPIRIYNSLHFRIWDFMQKQGCVFGEDTYFLSGSHLWNVSTERGRISLGGGCRIKGELFVYPYAGKIIVGDDCFIGEGTRIWSENSITIGNRVLISHNVDIHDCNDHPLDARLRYEHYKDIQKTGWLPKYELCSRPIKIEDDVWIGFGACIMKGVFIGAGAIVAAHAVVTHDVPAGAVVAGNPAMLVRS